MLAHRFISGNWTGSRDHLEHTMVVLSSGEFLSKCSGGGAWVRPTPQSPAKQIISFPFIAIAVFKSFGRSRNCSDGDDAPLLESRLPKPRFRDAFGLRSDFPTCPEITAPNPALNS